MHSRLHDAPRPAAREILKAQAVHRGKQSRVKWEIKREGKRVCIFETMSLSFLGTWGEVPKNCYMSQISGLRFEPGISHICNKSDLSALTWRSVCSLMAIVLHFDRQITITSECISCKTQHIKRINGRGVGTEELTPMRAPIDSKHHELWCTAHWVVFNFPQKDDDDDTGLRSDKGTEISILPIN